MTTSTHPSARVFKSLAQQTAQPKRFGGKVTARYLNFGVHLTLWAARIYPPECFELQCGFGDSTYWKCLSPSVNEYIDGIEKSITELLFYDAIDGIDVQLFAEPPSDSVDSGQPNAQNGWLTVRFDILNGSVGVNAIDYYIKEQALGVSLEALRASLFANLSSIGASLSKSFLIFCRLRGDVAPGALRRAEPEGPHWSAAKPIQFQRFLTSWIAVGNRPNAGRSLCRPGSEERELQGRKEGNLASKEVTEIESPDTIESPQSCGDDRVPANVHKGLHAGLKGISPNPNLDAMKRKDVELATARLRLSTEELYHPVIRASLSFNFF